MDHYVIQESTKNCPGIVHYLKSNTLEISGRSIHENPEIFFMPLIDWLEVHFEAGNSLNVRIQLEYINSGSAKCLIELLKKLTGYKRSGKDVSMKWLFEEDDESMQELGEHYRDNAGIPLIIEMV